MNKSNNIIIACLIVLILLQGTALVLNYQEKQAVTEKLESYEEKINSYEERLDKVDELLTKTGTLLDGVTTAIEEVQNAADNFSFFK